MTDVTDNIAADNPPEGYRPLDPPGTSCRCPNVWEGMSGRRYCAMIPGMGCDPNAHRASGDIDHTAAMAPLERAKASTGEILLELAATFEDYARQHLAKTPPDLDKAERNIKAAQRARAALVALADGVGEFLATLELIASEPIPMILYCPACGLQHIDEADTHDEAGDKLMQGKTPWDNPPHRSHLCAGCGTIWRPADRATVGVEAIETRGVDDSPDLAGSIALAASLKAMDGLPRAYPADLIESLAGRLECRFASGVDDTQQNIAIGGTFARELIGVLRAKALTPEGWEAYAKEHVTSTVLQGDDEAAALLKRMPEPLGPSLGVQVDHSTLIDVRNYLHGRAGMAL